MVIMGPSPSPSGSSWILPGLADGPLLVPHELRRARLIRHLRATAPIVLTAAVAGGVTVTVVERKRRRERLAAGGGWHSVTQVRCVTCCFPRPTRETGCCGTDAARLASWLASGVGKRGPSWGSTKRTGLTVPTLPAQATQRHT